MKLIGTGAAEAIPNPFCDCSICENARQTGGRENRTRSSLQVTPALHIDYNPDIYHQALQHNLHLHDLRHILLTHTHCDHFAIDQLGLREMGNDQHPEPLCLHLSPAAYDWAQHYYHSLGVSTVTQSPNTFHVHDLAYHRFPFHETQTIESYQITPFRGNHFGEGKDENAANYLICDGTTITYYATDTGMFLEETFQALAAHTIDTLIMECTFGDNRLPPNAGHLDCYSFAKVVEHLYKQGTLHSNSHVYTTHINHKHTLTYAKMVEWFAAHPLPVPVTVGYDGLDV